jgi:hypothetical protein
MLINESLAQTIFWGTMTPHGTIANPADTGWRPVYMKPFEINEKNGNLEVVAKITDSMVQEYGCRIKYNKESGQVDLVGEDYCKDVIEEVVNDMRED